MGGLGEPASAATVINNIFRNYEHRWIYDFDEISSAVGRCGTHSRGAVIHSRP